MIVTALANDAESPRARATQWRQLLDVLAQGDGQVSPEMRSAAIGRISDLQDSVPFSMRQAAAVQLAGRIRSVAVAILFARDEPAVAIPVLRALSVGDDDWRTLIASVPATARALLRNRRDLPQSALTALGSYGASDFALPADVRVADVEGGTQIRALVERIEAFRKGTGAVEQPAASQYSDSFAYQCASDGVVDWVAGAPREPLIGIALAEAADAGGFGVDGQAAGAFKRRAPFRDARLSVAGSGPSAGQWLLSGSPVFNTHNGRFSGYHGTARRPRPGEVAGPVARFGGTTLPVDSLRQLIHELRTPLNAVLGFAAMIDQQLLGPAAEVYRLRAHQIVDDGQKLLDMVDDLDHAARAPQGQTFETLVDVRDVVARVAGDLGARVILEPGPDLHVAVEERALERMLARLLGPMAALAGDGEGVGVSVEPGNGQPVIAVRRVAMIAGASEAMLFDRGVEADAAGSQMRALGLGFALRLVQNMARAAGGRLSVQPDAFVITLPGAPVASSLPAGMPRE